MTEERMRWKAALAYCLLLAPIAAFTVFAGTRWLQVADNGVEVGRFSPDGSKFVVRHVRSNNYYRNFRTCVHDARTGEVVSDLSEYAWDGGISWSPDGTRLIGILSSSEQRSVMQTIIIVEPSNPPRIVEQWTVMDQHIGQATFDQDGRAVGIRLVDQGVNRSRIEVLSSAEIIDTIEVGGSEEVAGFYATRDRRMFLRIEPKAVPNGDFVCTDGKSPTSYRIDLATQQRIELPKNTFLMRGNSEFVGEIQTGSPSLLLRHLDDLDSMLLQVPEATRMQFVSEDGSQLVQWFRVSGQGNAVVYDLANGEKSEFPTPIALQAVPTPDGDMMIPTENGKLIRMNLSDGTQHELLNVRPYAKQWQSVAMVGLGLLWTVGLLVGRSWEPSNPFAQMMSLLVFSLCIVIGWSALGSGAYMGRIDIESTGFVFFCAVCTFFMIWASTFKSFWGVTLPSCVAGSAAGIGIMFVWAQGDAYRVVEGTIGGSVMLPFMLIGLYVVRRRFGQITRDTNVAVSRGEPNIESQLSLKQMLLLVASCCFLFAAMRFVDPSQFVGLPNAVVFVTWLVTFVITMVLAAMLAFLTAFRVRSIALSCVAYLAGVVLLTGFHCLITRTWDVYLLWSVPTRYSLIAASGGLIWVTTRFCRSKGYRFVNDATS